MLGDLPPDLQLRMYPFASDAVFVAGIKFSIVKRSTTCFPIHFGVKSMRSYARAVSSVVRALASHTRGGDSKLAAIDLATKLG